MYHKSSSLFKSATFWALFTTITLFSISIATFTNNNSFSPRLFDKRFISTGNYLNDIQSLGTNDRFNTQSQTSSTMKTLGNVNIKLTPLPKNTTSLPTTQCPTCLHYYLIQVKPDFKTTFDKLDQQLSNSLSPHYNVITRINRELVVVSGPVNPSIELIQQIVPDFIQSAKKPKNEPDFNIFGQNTTSNPTAPHSDHELVDLLSLAHIDLIPIITDLGLLNNDEQIEMFSNFIQFLVKVNQISGIVGVSHYTPSMKISMQHLEKIWSFYTPNNADMISDNGEDGSDDEELIVSDVGLEFGPKGQEFVKHFSKTEKKLQKCLFETLFSRSKFSNFQSPPTEGSNQIESDAYLDVILDTHVNNSDNFDFNNLNFDQFQTLLKNNKKIFEKMLKNIQFRIVDDDGISISTRSTSPCQGLIEKYYTLEQVDRIIKHTTIPPLQNIQNNDFTSILEYASKQLILHLYTMPKQNHRDDVVAAISEQIECRNFQITTHKHNKDTIYLSYITPPSLKIPTQLSYAYLTLIPQLSTDHDNITQQLLLEQTKLNTCINSILSHPYLLSLTIQPRVDTQNIKAKFVLQDRNFATTKMWDKGLTGAGQTVIVGDTGVDYDHCLFHDANRPTTEYKSHIGLYKSTLPDYNQRKIIWYITNWGDQSDDSSGHGTHVAGTIAGYVDPSYPSKAIRDQLEPYSGHGKDTKLIVLDFKKNSINGLNIPEDLYAQIFEPFTTKVPSAAISSHSWGGDVGYTSYSLSTDQFCYNNPYHLVIFAGGNNGVQGFVTILSPGDAKNVLTVGATENLSELPGLTFAPITPLPKEDPNYFEPMTIPYVMAAFGRTAMQLPAAAGNVVVAENIEACEPLQTSGFNTVYNGAVVLVRRGKCSFVIMANFAYAAGASVVLVVNHLDTQPIQMGIDTTTPTYTRAFSVAMIAKRYGEILIKYAEHNRTPAFDVQNSSSTFSTLQSRIPLQVTGPVPYKGDDSFSHAMADFSSRGPTRDGRIKPDIVAPGKSIYSARSDGATGQTVNCPSGLSGVVALSGTSMATPAVAGEMSLVRQYFETGRYYDYLKTYLGQFYRGNNQDGETQPTPMNNIIDVLANISHTDAVVQLSKNLKLTSAALKTVAVASANAAQGSVQSYRKGESSYYLPVQSSPMSAFQGWGLFNVDRILQFNDDVTTYSLLNDNIDVTLKSPNPSSRLYVFDSQSEDVANIRYSLLTNSKSTPSRFKTQLNKYKEAKKIDADGLNLYTIDKLPKLLLDMTSPTQQSLSTQSIGLVTSPYSFVLDDTNSESINFQRCAPAISPDNLPDKMKLNSDTELYSCALTIDSVHQHCLSIQPEDIIHHVEYALYNGASPTTDVKIHSDVIQFSNIDVEHQFQNVARIDTLFKNFANPTTPTSNDPALARATLVWTDPPGSLQDERVLVNNLDLTVISKSNFKVLITPTAVALVTVLPGTKEDELIFEVSNPVEIDWGKYKVLFPRSFELTDAMLKTKNFFIDKAPPVNGINQFVSSLLHWDSNGSVSSTGNSHSPYENQKAMKNEEEVKKFVDVINNVEQASLDTRSVNLNAYVIAAAIELGQVIDFNVLVRSGSMATTLQHYAITTTGALPSGFYIPDSNANVKAFDAGMSPKNTQMAPQRTTATTATAATTTTTTTTGTCSIDQLTTSCPNNCNIKLNPLNRCIAGKCICSTKLIESTSYNSKISIQGAGYDCSIEPTVLDSLCFKTSAPNTNSCPSNSNTLDKVSSPLVNTASRLIQPWEWHYYSLPSNIVSQALALNVGSKVPKNNAAKAQKVVQHDTVYIGIKFAVNVADVAKPLVKGDPDLYISNKGIPTLNNFNYANRVCNSCSKDEQKRNQSPTPSSYNDKNNELGLELEVQNVEDISRGDVSTLMSTHNGFQQMLDQLESKHTTALRNDPTDFVSSSFRFSTMSEQGLTRDTFTALLYPGGDGNTSSLPKALQTDKDILWIDGSYFDSSPNKTITLGVYGYCCNSAYYDLSIYGIHVNDKPLVGEGEADSTPPEPTPVTPVDGNDNNVDNEADKADYMSNNDKYIFTLFFFIALTLFVGCFIVMCFKKYFQDVLENSVWCAPLRFCWSFNKIPAAQEESNDAYQRHGILYRICGCYYITTYCCFCFKLNSLSYAEQVNDEEVIGRGVISNEPTDGGLTPPQPQPKPKTSSANKQKKNAPSQQQPPEQHKRRVHNDGTTVSDLGPQQHNPFSTSQNDPYDDSSYARSTQPGIPRSAQRSLDEFEADPSLQTDQFMLEQEQDFSQNYLKSNDSKLRGRNQFDDSEFVLRGVSGTQDPLMVISQQGQQLPVPVPTTTTTTEEIRNDNNTDLNTQ